MLYHRFFSSLKIGINSFACIKHSQPEKVSHHVLPKYVFDFSAKEMISSFVISSHQDSFIVSGL